MKRFLPLLLCTAALGQSPVWVKVATTNPIKASAPVTARVGYADSTGNDWITFQYTNVGGYFAIPDTSKIPNPQNIYGAEVDVLQSGTPVVVTEYDVWTGDAASSDLEDIVTYAIPASGPVVITNAPQNPVTPVVTPPVVTPPPVVVTPPAKTPLGQFNCLVTEYSDFTFTANSTDCKPVTP